MAVARPFLEVEGRELVRVVQDEVGLEKSLQLLAEDLGAGTSREELAELYDLTETQVWQGF